MKLDSANIKSFIDKLFAKYYFDQVLVDEFYDSELFDKALISFQNDFNRYFSGEIILEKVKARIELIGFLLYRISRQYYFNHNEKVAAQMSNLARLITGFEIYYSAEIGKGLKINHGLGTVLGARIKIGENALIHQNVTLGDKNGGRPELLDNVTVYAGAVILESVLCGNNTTVGANCVCLIDVPENKTIIGIPGRIKI